MLFKDTKGSDVFGAGRGVLLTHMTPREKITMLGMLPRKAYHIKSCLRAFWKLELTFDVDKALPSLAEPLWRNGRFQLDITSQLRSYFVNVSKIVTLGDVLDVSTGLRFTDHELSERIEAQHMHFVREVPTDIFVRLKLRALLAAIGDVPAELGRLLMDTWAADPKDGQVVALRDPDADPDRTEVRYATYCKSHEGDVSFKLLRRDGVALMHSLGQSTRAMGHDILQVATWGSRVIGPTHFSFPHSRGWLMKGKRVSLHELTIRALTRSLTMRKFLPPTAEQGWNSRLFSVTIPWKEVWKLVPMYVTPRDTFAHAKLLRRNLFTASRDPDSDGRCMCCGSLENQLHLATCVHIRRHFWRPILMLTGNLGFSFPITWDGVTAYLITLAITDTTVATREQAALVVLGWRCLYAELVGARVEDKSVRMRRALQRWSHLLIQRLTAYGEGWKRWCNTRIHTSQTCVVPPSVQEELKMIFIEQDGTYRISSIIEEVHHDAQGDGDEPVLMRVPRRVPRQAAGGRADAYAQGGDHFHSPRDESFDRQGASPPDDGRDLAGDAKTWAQAQRERITSRTEVYAECPLASARNVLRNPDVTREFLIRHQVGGADDDPDRMGFPDWPAILELIRNEDEVIIQFNMARLRPGPGITGARALVIATFNPDHVIAVLKHNALFRVYDNDSPARLRGVPTEVPPDRLPRHGICTAITRRNSWLHAEATAMVSGPEPLTTPPESILISD